MTSAGARWRAFAVAALGITCASGATYAQAPAVTTVTPTDKTSVVCNSLTGPFCLALGATTHFSPYMTPITTESLYKPAARDKSAVEASESKQCFFMHFARNWMDSGGDENDLMSKMVQSVDECEALCCEHPQCQSFTFWMGSTCFLRARRSEPREDGNSFSGNRIG